MEPIKWLKQARGIQYPHIINQKSLINESKGIEIHKNHHETSIGKQITFVLINKGENYNHL